MPRVYSSPIGPPTLGQHLAQLAFEFSNASRCPSLTRLDPDVVALRDAFQLALAPQRDEVADHIRYDGRAADPDRWDFLYGAGYRAWLGAMDAACDMLNDIPLEPCFDD